MVLFFCGWCAVFEVRTWVCDVAMHGHDKFLLQEWANLEGGKLKLVAQHVINLTYRTIKARPYVCVSS